MSRNNQRRSYSCNKNSEERVKATGPEKIEVEILKLTADNESKRLDLITSLIKKIYNSGKIPLDWLKSTFVTLLKKLTS